MWLMLDGRGAHLLPKLFHVNAVCLFVLCLLLFDLVISTLISPFLRPNGVPRYYINVKHRPVKPDHSGSIALGLIEFIWWLDGFICTTYTGGQIGRQCDFRRFRSFRVRFDLGFDSFAEKFPFEFWKWDQFIIENVKSLETLKNGLYKFLIFKKS